MAFDVSGLSNYTKEYEAKLVSKSHFGSKTAQLVMAAGILLTGVKSSEKIPILATDVVFQAGGTCGFNSSGTTTFSDRTVTTGKIKVNEALCPKTLESKAIQKKIIAGSRPNTIPFAQDYAEEKAQLTAESIELGIWQGDTASGSANLNKFDGYLKQIDAAAASIIATNAKKGTGTATATTGATAVVGVGTKFLTEVAVGDKLYNVSGTLIGTVATITDDTHLDFAANGAVAITGAAYAIAPKVGFHFGSPISSITDSNVRSVVSGMWRSLPAALKGKSDVRIFCGWDVFESFMQALTDANLFHYTADNTDGELTIPGTQYKIVAVHGLDATNRLIALRLSNMAIGVDLENEEEKFEIFYAKEADEVRYVNEFKYGVNVALPGEIVSFALLDVA